MNQSLIPRLLLLVLWPGLGAAIPGFADGPDDNRADRVRRIPPPGIAISDELRSSLTARVERLGKAVADWEQEAAGPADRPSLLPDVLIFDEAWRLQPR